MKRILSLICLLLTFVLLFSLVSCDISDLSDLFDDPNSVDTRNEDGDDDEDEETRKKDKETEEPEETKNHDKIDNSDISTPVEPTPTPPINNIHDNLDFGGKTVTFLCINTSLDFAEEMNGSVVNDAMYQRQISLEESMNIELVFEEKSSYTSMVQYIQIDLASGEEQFDVINISQSYLTSLATSGALANINNKANFPYLDLDSNCWVDSYNDAATINGRIYSIAGNANFSLYQNTPVITVNTNLLRDLQLPDMNSLYKSAADGEWTWEYFKQLASSAYFDSNGNSQVDAADCFGFSTTEENAYSIPISGCSLADTANNSNLIAMPQDDSDILKVHEMLSMVYDKDGSIYFENDVFSNRNALFGMHRLGQLPSLSSNMKIGVLPIPKVSATQQGYPSGAVTFDATSVLANRSDTVAISATLQYLNIYSRTEVLSAFLNECATHCSGNTVDLSSTLDIIFHGHTYDFADVYGLGTEIRNDIMDALINSDSLSSTFAANKRKWNTTIEELEDSLIFD